MIYDNSAFSSDPNITLRDARHAHVFYTQNAHLFTPKVKFLYHVVFSFTANAQGKSPISEKYKNELSVLAKEVDLPQYTAQIVTKQQYNRKKHIQTRIDYNDVKIVFHDDSLGASRAMFEEYYNYYFRDGQTQDSNTRFDSLDKLAENVPRYGLDNAVVAPFFNYIKIYQMARQRWFSYTLLNPILSSWGHDTLAYSEGAGTTENRMVVNYEGVLYENGNIDVDRNNNMTDGPAGFTEAGYDLTPSPRTPSTATPYSPLRDLTSRNNP